MFGIAVWLTYVRMCSTITTTTTNTIITTITITITTTTTVHVRVSCVADLCANGHVEGH